jgi:hypothetical protein
VRTSECARGVTTRVTASARAWGSALIPGRCRRRLPRRRGRTIGRLWLGWRWRRRPEACHARSVTLDCTLPPSMWVEAISTVNYLHARNPTSSNNGMTPYEKLFGRKLEVGHLRRFGCKAFKTLPATHRSKFGTRADALFMLGYLHDITTIWHFWDPPGGR